jgi:hypothetical protein
MLLLLWIWYIGNLLLSTVVSVAKQAMNAAAVVAVAAVLTLE